MKITVLMEKWCDLNPGLGVTSGNSNLLGSLESSGLADVEVLYYDEYFHNNNELIDRHLMDRLYDNKPDLLVVSYYPVWDDPRNVARTTFEAIKGVGIPIAFFWFDSIHPHIMGLAKSLSCYAKLNILIDGSNPFDENCLCLWVPQDERIFCLNPSIDRNIDVTFCGTVGPYAERINYTKYLLAHGIPLTITGGQREHRLSIQDYAQILQRAKISINFSGKPDGRHQAKSRIYETMLCGTMLLEQNTEPIRKWFKPMEHYVPFDNEQDLVNKIQYYLNKPEERNQIAEQGQKFMLETYNSKNWWQQVLNRL